MGRSAEENAVVSRLDLLTLFGKGSLLVFVVCPVTGARLRWRAGGASVGFSPDEHEVVQVLTRGKAQEVKDGTADELRFLPSLFL